MPHKVNILLVDNLDENLRALEALLHFEDCKILKAKSGREALELLVDHECAVALVDVQMPEMDGFELAELMRGMERTRHVPIIFVTASNRSPERTFEGYESGAVDFLYKPLDPHIVRSKVRVFYELNRQKKLLQEQLEVTKTTLSDLKRTESELQKALEIRSEFFSIASHELKTPITSLNLQLQLLRRQVKLEENVAPAPEKLARSLDVCSTQVKRLTSLIEDMLDISRIQAGKLSFRFNEINISNLVKECLEHYCEQFRAARCPIEEDIEPDIVTFIDRDRIEQVLVNILSNAVKYAPGEALQIKLNKKGKEIFLSIRDHGPGIAEEKRNAIFERFERAEASRNISGLGLGLFICKQIIKGHNGEIWVESGDNQKGSKFVIKLPLRDADSKLPPVDERRLA